MSRGSTRQRWHELIRQQGSSGLSVAEFCRRQDISQASFYQWRKKLQSDDAFVPLSVVGAAGVSVELPCGAVVRISSGDDRSLRQVLLLLMGEEEAP